MRSRRPLHLHKVGAFGSLCILGACAAGGLRQRLLLQNDTKRVGFPTLAGSSALRDRHQGHRDQVAKLTQRRTASVKSRIRADLKSAATRLKAFYINTDLDDARRVGLMATCAQLELDCQRVVPPKLSSPEVMDCVDKTPLRSFECSLVHAHRGILLQASAGSDSQT
eukprot:TRINITY_DN33914_c0_g1_i1.p1 TRINITY_DN33914_c0_g1~~TRINITY_DN33914_c0_g1_i1.p1  ORF type:complete len:175 (-),score=22.56 TRINITY_DN33914_c0_g1_i1:105-605(-)